MTPEVSSPDSHPNPNLSQIDLHLELPPLPICPPNPPLATPSFILTPLPIPMSNLRSSQPITPPPETLNLQPPLTPEVFRRLKPRFHHEADIIPVVGRADLSNEDKDEDRENQTPLKQRRPTDAELEVSNSAPDPHDSAHRPRLCPVLGIHLRTALTNEGLAKLHVEGLVQVQTLCWMIAVMTMNLTKISEENAERSIHDSGGDADFLFVGTDPRKVQRFDVGSSVYGRMAEGWQPTGDRSNIPAPQNANETSETVGEMPSTPILWSIDEMPDMLYDYDTELYGDGEL
ncbi:hypothetical protein Moror_14434 [Moniliophthora roreri MCA 2997]|uniref:Reverse transcriptase-rnase h-integrase n=1 Tax=Moniliophthora roreri (strain MCA 2997) TaxID=1381753 RepID=V2WI29_MONRO|nr:hypothetical protein Moror_14434 [Moniliophthora roreri MCA 2997]